MVRPISLGLPSTKNAGLVPVGPDQEGDGRGGACGHRLLGRRVQEPTVDDRGHQEAGIGPGLDVLRPGGDQLLGRYSGERGAGAGHAQMGGQPLGPLGGHLAQV